jgi:hypothetical protein
VLTQQLLYAKVVFNQQFAELYSNGFQEFFQKLMQYRYPTFLPVRAYGSIGDMGSDGLCTDQEKLYACYGPQSPAESETRRKFRSDLASALSNRPGEFTTFVFVHNDRIGMHPQIASELVTASQGNPSLTFEQMGRLAFWREFMRLEILEAEDMLGQEIKVESLVYGISLADLEPLLIHLGRVRDRSDLAVAHTIPMNKIEFNRLSADIRDFLIHGMRFAKQVADYYEGFYDVLARDETAADFRERYESLLAQTLTPDEIFQELFVYVAGNRALDAAALTSVYTILSYFFQTCDIFEEPPADFGHHVGGES